MSEQPICRDCKQPITGSTPVRYGDSEEFMHWTDGHCHTALLARVAELEAALRSLEVVRDVLNPSTGNRGNAAALTECYLLLRRAVEPVLQQDALRARAALGGGKGE